MKKIVTFSMIFTLLGCSTTDNQLYKSTTPRDTYILLTPPDLISPDTSNGLKLQTESNNLISNNDSYVSPSTIGGMELVNTGSQRWLVVKNSQVDLVWGSLIGFVEQMGLTVKYKNRALGVIQTDWATRNTTVPQKSAVRDVFSWVGWGSMYSLDARYSYRIMVSQSGNDIVLMVSHYEMDEVYAGCQTANASSIAGRWKASSDDQRSMWMAVPPNPQLELEFLTQYMLFGGKITKVQAEAIVAENKISENNLPITKDDMILIPDTLDRAWWRVAIALNRVGLGISDKNRERGEYYVYPLKTQVDAPDKNEVSEFFSKWFTGDADKNITDVKLPDPLYTVKLSNAVSQKNEVQLNFERFGDGQMKETDFIVERKKYLTGLAQELK